MNNRTTVVTVSRTPLTAKTQVQHQVHVGFMAGKVAQGYAFCEYFGFTLSATLTIRIPTITGAITLATDVLHNALFKQVQNTKPQPTKGVWGGGLVAKIGHERYLIRRAMD